MLHLSEVQGQPRRNSKSNLLFRATTSSSSLASDHASATQLTCFLFSYGPSLVGLPVTISLKRPVMRHFWSRLGSEEIDHGPDGKLDIGSVRSVYVGCG